MIEVESSGSTLLLFSRSFQVAATWSSPTRPISYNLAPSILDSKRQRLMVCCDLEQVLPLSLTFSLEI